MKINLRALRRRVVEIDYEHGHRHLPGSLSALPIIAGIYEKFNFPCDVFILSKGHAAAALYAVLESAGYAPNVSEIHPERDIANGIVNTSGSLGHGLPMAVGLAWAKRHLRQPGFVHVLMGDGEAQEGTTWEALNLAAVLNLENLVVHLDANDYQGSCAALVQDIGSKMNALFPVTIHRIPKGYGVKMFERNPSESVHTVTVAEYAEIMEELK